MANTWQGNFPHENLRADGFARTSPVTAFPPNGYGVHDMIGNVWEWTRDWYAPKHDADAPKACCIPENPRGGREEESYDPCQPRHQDPPQGAEGRLASVRAELLPPLPAGRAPRAAGRHLDEPCRIPLRRAGQGARVTTQDRQQARNSLGASRRRRDCRPVRARHRLVRDLRRGAPAHLARHRRAPRRADDVPLPPAAAAWPPSPRCTTASRTRDRPHALSLDRCSPIRPSAAGRLREGLISTARIILLGLGMDAIYQCDGARRPSTRARW